MNIDTALSTLGLDNRASITPDEIQNAYLMLVKSKKNESDFLELLKEFNVARDTLNDEIASNLPAILKSNSDLNELMVQQAEIARARDAKDELKQTFNTTKAKLISRPKRARDSALYLTAASAASTFIFSNMKDVFAQSTLPPTLNVILVLCTFLITGTFGAMAFLANSSAVQLENDIDAFYEQITRVRNTKKIVDEIFSKSNKIPEDELEMKLLEALQKMMNSRSRLGGFDFIGKGTIHIDDAKDFTDQYLDYLLNRGLIRLEKDARNNRFFTFVDE